jgi:hypothetical protein
MTLRRLELLQWFGFVFGGVMWFVLFLAGVGASVAACNPAGQRWGIPHDPVQIALLTAGLLALAAAEAAAVTVFRATRQAEEEGPPPESRMRFFAIGAMAGDAVFFVILVLSEVATIVTRACHQA